MIDPPKTLVHPKLAEVGLGRPEPTQWPWPEMAEAAARLEDARSRRMAAQTYGDINARERANLDEFSALADAQTVREDVARLVLYGLRILLTDRPADLDSILSETPVIRDILTAVAEGVGRG